MYVFTRFNDSDLNKKSCPSYEGQLFYFEKGSGAQAARLEKQRAELAGKSFWRVQRTLFQQGSLVAEGMLRA